MTRVRRALDWIGPRLRRFLVWAGLAVAALVVLLLAWVGVLVLTNPEPSDREQWDRHADMPGGRSEVASAVAGGRIYAVGGFERLYRTSDDVVVYDPRADAWEDGPDLPSRRHHAAAAVLGGALYVAGGGGSALDWDGAREMWSLARGGSEWEEQPPMPEGRVGHDMVAVGGRLYVVGGEGGSRRVLVFDPERGWTAGSEVPGGTRDHVCAVARDGEVWVIGGRDGSLSARVDVYDVEADSWRRAPDLPRGLSAMAVGVVDGTIHVVGGEDPSLVGGRVFADHLALDPAGEGDWERLEEPMLAVHGAGYGVVDGRLYVAGGARRQGPLSGISFTGLTQSFSPSPARS